MLSKYSVKRPYTVFVGILLIIVLGVISYLNITVDLVPSVNLPYVVISTTYIGASPEKIEKEIAKPIEQNLAGINNIKGISSISSENISVIILEFGEKVNLDATMIEIRENLDLAKNQFNSDVENPVIMKLNPNSLPIMMISVSNDSMNNDELVEYIETEIASQIKSIEGVASINLDGETKNSVDLNISKEKIDLINQSIEKLYFNKLLLSGQFNSVDEIKKMGLDLPEEMKFNISEEIVNNIIVGQNFSMPSYNIIDDSSQNIRVKIGDEFENLDELENMIVMSIPEIGDIKIKDICDISIYDNSDEIYTKVDGKESIILSIQKQSEFSTAEITEQVWEKLDKVKGESENIEFKTLMDQGRYVGIMLGQIAKNLLMGAIFAIIVLFFFLRNIRATIIVTASIFISIITALILMYLTNISLNMISLGGLALAVGMLVDNSIVVLENIFRYRNSQMNVEDASIKGAREVSGAIIASTLTTVIVFVPIVFTHGLTKELFTDMALTIAFALISSLLVALTLVPAATSIMKKKKDENSVKTKNNIVDKLIKKYVDFLNVSLRYKWVTFTIVIMLFITSILTVLKSDVSLFPVLDSGNIWIKADIPDNYSSKDKQNKLDELYNIIKKVKYVKTVGIIDKEKELDSANVMMSLAGDGVPLYVLLEDDRDLSTNEVRNEIEKVTKNIEYPLSINSDGLDLSQMMNDDIVIQLYDNDIEGLISKAIDIKKELLNIEGISEIMTEFEGSSKELKIEVDKDESIKKGLTIGQIYMVVTNNIKPHNKITSVESNNKNYDVYIKDSRVSEINEGNIGDLSIVNNNNEIFKLTDLANISEQNSSNNIYRNNGNRYVELKVSVKDGFKAKKVNDKIEELLVKENMQYKISGEIFEIGSSFSELYFMMIMAIIFIYLIMVAQFQSLKSPFIVMFTILLALTGGFLALYFTGYPLSIVSIIGLIVLVGIVVNNGIVFVDYTNQQMKKGIDKKEAILLAGKNRLRPILMTAFTTIIALITSAVDNSMGSEMLRPMAITTIGGMIYATILTLFLIPALYDIIVRKNRGE